MMESISLNNYSIPIPTPSMDDLEKLAQFSIPDGVVCVYWKRETQQAIIELNDAYFVQNDQYITDALAEILNIRESTIVVKDLRVGNIFELGKLDYADSEMVQSIYKCKWSDYTCDYLVMQADLHFQHDD